jgi:predicted N-formylglutamate amidohydrolase
MTLLGNEDPAPFTVHNPQGSSPFVLVADHAGQQIPRQLADLGLPQAELDRHIGWDIGIAGVTEQLASVYSPWVRALCQTPAGTTACGRSPAAKPDPSR